jgi:glutaminase
MAELVQRYLDRIREEHAGVAKGALADYIAELASVDPNGIRGVVVILGWVCV